MGSEETAAEMEAAPGNYSVSMGWMCPDPLLDSSLHWDTEVPDFSVCLQKTLLVWLPCGFLWACAPFVIHSRLSSRQLQIPHTLLNIVATILAAGLVLLAAADLIYFAASPDARLVDCLDPALRGLTWLLVAVLVQLNRARGCRNSGVLWIFWTLLVVLGVPRIYSQLRRELDPAVAGDDLTETLSSVITFVIILAQWILSFFMDAKPTYTAGEGKYSKFHYRCREL